MTHVGLHRANQKLAPTFAPLPKHRTQRFGFDRVAQRRSRSVRLHIPHLPGFDPRSTVSRTTLRPDSPLNLQSIPISGLPMPAPPSTASTTTPRNLHLVQIHPHH